MAVKLKADIDVEIELTDGDRTGKEALEQALCDLTPIIQRQPGVKWVKIAIGPIRTVVTSGQRLNTETEAGVVFG